MNREATTPTNPICYLAVSNETTRASLAAQLSEQGFWVVPKQTGFDLLADLSGAILGDEPPAVDLVVVEDRLPGCRGSSIARGLQELGIGIPVRLIGDDQAWPLSEPPLAA